MRVLHINYRDLGGGAANAANLIHQSLREAGVDSKMLVIDKHSQDPGVISAWTGLGKAYWWVRKKLSKVTELVQRDPSGAFCSSNFLAPSLLKQIKLQSPDIIHLHWIGSDTMDLKDLAQLNCPIVWTLHDMWPFCGTEHCALPWKGERWSSGYAPENRNAPATGIDLNQYTWNQKVKHWSQLGIHCVATSAWMRDCANRSQLTHLGAFRGAEKIHCGIDTNHFYSVDQAECREQLSLPQEGTILSFGAQNVDIETKGFRYLIQALERLDGSKPITILTFGSGKIPPLKNTQHIHFGSINDPAKLRLIYSASDLFLMPSLIESFGLVAAEAMACGTPVVCFDTTGLKDVVGHQSEGYRAKLFDADDFAAGIQWCLADADRLWQMKQAAQDKVHAHFTVEQLRNSYLKLYAKVLTQ